MKKGIALLIVVFLLTAVMTGCGKLERENYKEGTKKYVDLCDLSGITVEEDSDDYKQNLSGRINDYLSGYPQTLTEGTVADGDVAKIDYVGKIGGVAFTGGTAQGYDLTIGSSTFVDDFEQQLIGMSIGQTADITVTFPDGYSDTTDLETQSKAIKLANQDAVFTVTIRSISRPYTEANEEFAKAAGFDSVEAFMTEMKDYALKDCVYSQMVEKSTIKKIPAEDVGTPYPYFKNYYTQYATANGGKFEDFLTYNKMTESAFREELLKPSLILYACFDRLNLSLDAGAVDEQIKTLATENSVTEEQVVTDLTRNYIEFQLVSEKVMDAAAEKVTFVPSAT